MFVSVVVINIVRLTLMAQSVKMFELVHGDAGWAAINAIITVNGLLWAAMSVVVKSSRSFWLATSLVLR